MDRYIIRQNTSAESLRRFSQVGYTHLVVWFAESRFTPGMKLFNSFTTSEVMVQYYLDNAGPDMMDVDVVAISEILGE